MLGTRDSAEVQDGGMVIEGRRWSHASWELEMGHLADPTGAACRFGAWNRRDPSIAVSVLQHINAFVKGLLGRYLSRSIMGSKAPRCGRY